MRVLKLRRPKKEKEDAKNFNLADVRCPYFDRFYRGKSIKCEGFGKDGSYLICGFATENEWVNHVNLYCNCDWEMCPVARVLTDKYENE